METILHPLSGLQISDNGFSLPPAVPDDFGEKMYDLRALLRGGSEGGFELEISEEIRRSVPELPTRGTLAQQQPAASTQKLIARWRISVRRT
jgi:hypothetical protein